VGGQTFIVLLIKRLRGLASVARFRHINGSKLSGREKSSEIRELSYGRIVARLTPVREGTRFALSVSPRRRSDPSVSRVLHIKGFSLFFLAFTVIPSG